MTLATDEQVVTSDIAALRAVASGDEEALASLYDRYRLILFGLILRILHSRDDAEDVLQELFLQVWKRATDFDPTRGKPFTWLVTMARSRAIDRLRAQASRDRLATEVAHTVSDESGSSDAAEDALRSEQREIVGKALAALPEEQKRALLLAYFEGLTQAEIAERLGTPLGTVKTRMRSGMTKLRDLLSQRLDSAG
jgi:RNA polymerase sigma-70 factor, ECF subfamily